MSDVKLLNSATGQFFGDFNDIEFENNDLKLISDKPYAQQITVKGLLTEVGSSSLFTNYGSVLQKLVNAKLSSLTVQSDISNGMLTTLAYVKGVEESKESSERIKTVDFIRVEPSIGVSTGFIVQLQVTLENGEKLAITLGG